MPVQPERLWHLSSFVLAYEAEEKDYDAPEQPGRRRVSSALAGEAETGEAEGRHASEKEVECPDHSPEEEAECPDSPEEEEEVEASSSEG